MSSLLIVLRTYVVIYDPTTTTIFRNQVLINFISIAIWNQNIVVLVLAISIWVTNIAFHLQSKSIPPPRRRPRISCKRGLGTDVITVNGQFFCCSGSFGLIPSVVSLCLGPCAPRLRERQDRSRLTCFLHLNNFRNGPVSDRVCRFARHALSPRCYVWSDPPHLEPGEVSAVVLLIHNFNLDFFLRKGVIWLILGCAADIPPLVSPGSL